MATDTATGQSMGVVNFASGGFTGDGTATTVTLGFKPRHIHLINATDRIQQIWHGNLAATQTINIAAAGTATLDTNTLISSPTDKTFLIAAGASVNAKVYVWSAWG